MADAPATLTQERLDAFMEKFNAFRESLGPEDQKLLDAMYLAAMGQHEKTEEEVQSYWVAAGPRGVAVGGPYGVAAAPWGAAYGYRVY
jgi:hypothetical protein